MTIDQAIDALERRCGKFEWFLGIDEPETPLQSYLNVRVSSLKGAKQVLPYRHYFGFRVHLRLVRE